MKSSDFLLWLPRILSILFAALISLFALDVFSLPNWPIALLIHLIPTYILAIFTVISWRKPRLGGWLFILTSLYLAFWTNFQALFLALPTLLIGILYLSNYLTKNNVRQ